MAIWTRCLGTLKHANRRNQISDLLRQNVQYLQDKYGSAALRPKNIYGLWPLKDLFLKIYREKLNYNRLFWRGVSRDLLALGSDRPCRRIVVNTRFSPLLPFLRSDPARALSLPWTVAGLLLPVRRHRPLSLCGFCPGPQTPFVPIFELEMSFQDKMYSALGP